MIFVEHDPSLFKNAMDTIEPIVGALIDKACGEICHAFSPGNNGKICP